MRASAWYVALPGTYCSSRSGRKSKGVHMDGPKKKHQTNQSERRTEQKAMNGECVQGQGKKNTKTT